jgi:hypothetical protein
MRSRQLLTIRRFERFMAECQPELDSAHGRPMSGSRP